MQFHINIHHHNQSASRTMNFSIALLLVSALLVTIIDATGNYATSSAAGKRTGNGQSRSLAQGGEYTYADAPVMPGRSGKGQSRGASEGGYSYASHVAQKNKSRQGRGYSRLVDPPAPYASAHGGSEGMQSRGHSKAQARAPVSAKSHQRKAAKARASHKGRDKKAAAQFQAHAHKTRKSSKSRAGVQRKHVQRARARARLAGKPGKRNGRHHKKLTNRSVIAIASPGTIATGQFPGNPEPGLPFPLAPPADPAPPGDIPGTGEPAESAGVAIPKTLSNRQSPGYGRHGGNGGYGDGYNVGYDQSDDTAYN